MSLYDTIIENIRQNRAYWRMVKGESFISAIGIHPKALEYFDYHNGATTNFYFSGELPSEPPGMAKIERLINGYSSAREFYIDKLRTCILDAADDLKPNNILYRTTDFRYRELINLVAFHDFEPTLQNEDLGNKGICRYLMKNHKELFRWEMEAYALASMEQSVRIALLFPFVRGERTLQIILDQISECGVPAPPATGIMIEIPGNVLALDGYADAFQSYKKDTGAEPMCVLGLYDLLMTFQSLPRDGSLQRDMYPEILDIQPQFRFDFAGKPGFWSFVERALLKAVDLGIHCGVGIDVLEQALKEAGDLAIPLVYYTDFFTENHYIVEIP